MKTNKLNIYVLIDSSGSIEEKERYALNSFINNVITYSKEKEKRIDNIELKVGVISFNDYAYFLTNGLVDIKKAQVKEIEGRGLTEVSKAFKLLKKNIEKDVSAIYLLIMDGEPSDFYMRSLEELKENKEFNNNIKIGCGFNTANINILKHFTGNSENVVFIQNKNNIFSELDLIYKITLDECLKQKNNVFKCTKPIEEIVIRKIKEEREKRGFK